MKRHIPIRFNKAFWIGIILCLTGIQTVCAEKAAVIPELSEDASFSLLTVYPRSKAVYAIFGHTAVRIQDTAQNIDWVFNYGYFNSSRPNFIYHFVKGETDYILGIDDFNNFLYSYSADNSHVVEQTLNLSAAEKTAFFNFLATNALPENRGYRYSYAFDNCTTRPRDILENCVEGKISYSPQKEKTTLRDLIHGCTKPYPWLSFGIDLVLGSGLDSIVGARTEMFLPVKLMNAFDKAVIVKDGESHPLIKGTQTLLTPAPEKESGTSLFTPLLTGILLLVVVLAMTVVGIYKKRSFKGLDFILFFVAGIAGCIVCFICFISTHPCTSGNFNVFWLHPLHLVAAPFFLLKVGQKFTYWYHLINFVLLTGFILAWYFIPQALPIAALAPLICLWLRSGYQIKNKNKRATKIK